MEIQNIDREIERNRSTEFCGEFENPQRKQKRKPISIPCDNCDCAKGCTFEKFMGCQEEWK